MTRFWNWQSSLSAYLTSCATKPFEYGAMDCGLFVAGAISVMTGVDVAANVRGYRNRTEAFEAIKAMCGHATMPAATDHLAAMFGIAEIPVAFAQRGDAVQLRRGRAASLGLVAMHGTEILTPFRDGLLRLPMSHATRAWRV